MTTEQMKRMICIATIPLAFTTGIFAGRYLEKHCEKKEAKLPVGAEEEDDDDFDWDEPITLRNPYDGMTEAFEDLEERISDLEDAVENLCSKDSGEPEKAKKT